MELTGSIKDVTVDYFTKRTNITLNVNEVDALVQGYEKLKDTELLDIKIVKHRKKRSLDANAYFHVLVGKIAEALVISKAKSKNVLIGKYGQPELLPDGNILYYKTTAPVEYMQELEYIHSVPVRFVVEDGVEVVFYKLMRGSHTYDTDEMSKLIDGTVSDAKELGIETMTPEELERMKSLWKA